MKSQFGDKILNSLEESWAGSRMDFRVGAMGQAVNGNLEVKEDHVKVEVQLLYRILPWWPKRPKALSKSKAR